MKKKYTAPLSIAVMTMSLLTLTSCGNNNDTSVSAMNEIPMPTETSTITEETSSIEIETQSETETREEEEDSTSTDIPFAEGEERGEYLSTVEEATEPTETIQKAPFTVDDLDFSGEGGLFKTAEEKKDYLQMVIDEYEAGEEDFYSLMGALADVGIDNTEFINEYEKTHKSSSSNTDTTVSYPENYNPADYGLTPQQDTEWTGDAWKSHPELSDVHAY